MGMAWLRQADNAPVNPSRHFDDHVLFTLPMVESPSRAELKRNLRVLQETIEVRPTDLDARMRLARTYRLMGNPAEAVVHYASVARYASLAGHPLHSIAVLRELLQVDPSHEESRLFLTKLEARTQTAAAKPLLADESATFAVLPDGLSPSTLELWQAKQQPQALDELSRTLDVTDVGAIASQDDSQTIEEAQIEGEWTEGNEPSDVVEPAPEDVLLPSVPLFAGLNRAQRQHLRHAMVYGVADPNDVLFREGDDSDSIIVIGHGRAAVTRHVDGQEVTLQELGPRDVAGMFGLHEHRPRQATVVALTALEYVEIDRLAMLALFEAHPAARTMVESAFRERLLRSAAAGLLPSSTSNPAAIDQLIGRMQERSYEAGDDLIFVGLDSDGIWIILEGEVALGMPDEEGNVVAETLLRIGDYVGCLAKRHDGEVDVGAVAHTAVRVALIGHRAVAELCDHDQGRGEVAMLEQTLRVSDHVFIGNVLAMRSSKPAR
jgi:CRP-like cAMP-binding protein